MKGGKEGRQSEILTQPDNLTVNTPAAHTASVRSLRLPHRACKCSRQMIYDCARVDL